jgi:hypothetical protein
MKDSSCRILGRLTTSDIETGFCQSSSAFLCQYNSTAAPYALTYHREAVIDRNFMET